MRRASLRTLALLLTLTLLAQLFPLAALADAPSFSNIYDACDYLRTCMDARETEIGLFLDENACARWETDEVREALADTMSMAGSISVRIDRHDDRSADVRISLEYCDAVREKIEAGEDYLIEDMRFHWFLAKCSHNMVVEPLMPIIDAAVISIANITRKELLTMTIDTHKEILDAVRDRDPQAARSAMSVHLDTNRIFIRQTKTAR